jgi:hypothetical protein
LSPTKATSTPASPTDPQSQKKLRKEANLNRSLEEENALREAALEEFNAVKEMEVDKGR